MNRMSMSTTWLLILVIFAIFSSAQSSNSETQTVEPPTQIDRQNLDNNPSLLTAENVQLYADSTQRINNVIEKRPELLYLLTPEQIRQANTEIISLVKVEDAQKYISKRVTEGGGSFVPDPSDRNEWILWKKAHPSLQMDDSLRTTNLALGNGMIQMQNNEIVFGSNSIQIITDGGKVHIKIGTFDITSLDGKMNVNEQGIPVVEKGSKFSFISRLTGTEVDVVQTTGDIQLGKCGSSSISCLDEYNRERIKNIGALSNPSIKSETRFTRELDVNLRDGNRLVLNIQRDGFDDMTINKKEDSEALVNVFKDQQKVATAYFPKLGNPGIQLLDEVSAGSLTPNFHFNFGDEYGETHDCHIIDGNMMVCSDCKLVGGVKTLGENALPIELKHPAYNLNGNMVVIGGTFRPVLDRAWYGQKIQEAAERGIDPYFWIAFSIVEYGGKRVDGAEPEKINSRGLSHLPVGNNFVANNGAAGVLIGDQLLYSGLLYQSSVQKVLRDMGAPLVNNPYFDNPARANRLQTIANSMGVPVENLRQLYYFYPTNGGGPVTQEQIDTQSFVLLSQFQNNVLSQTRRTGDIDSGLQSLHGYGRLPYLYRDGDYGDGKEVRYNPKDNSLVPGKAFGSGISGKDYPIYGYTLSNFIKNLYDNPQISSMVPPNTKTPITDKVLTKYNQQNKITAASR